MTLRELRDRLNTINPAWLDDDAIVEFIPRNAYDEDGHDEVRIVDVLDDGSLRGRPQ